MIEVRRMAESDDLFSFAVVIRDAEGESRHEVTMARQDCERIGQGRHGPEQCIEAAFRFLLDRERKEQILPRFDASVIAHYFPEFERELPRYLAKA